MNLNLATLKKSLSECHWTSGDKKLKMLADVDNPSYLLHRIMECVAECEAENEIEENSKLGIQLFNLYRVLKNATAKTEKGPTIGTGSSDTGKDNSGSAES